MAVALFSSQRPQQHPQPMDTQLDCHHRRLPTLVQLCQRVALSQIDSITSLGNLPYSLAKPILERCNVEQLLRFENLSPDLQSFTPELWRDWCFRKYLLSAESRYSVDDEPQEPDSWRSRFFVLEDAERRRFDELGSKLRTKRMEADERKKEKEVKYTDRLYHRDKRPRTGGLNSPTQQRSLFQKTKLDACKRQRAYYTARSLPPMSTAKDYRVLPRPPGASLPPVASSITESRVVVSKVVHRRPVVATAKPAVPATSLSQSTKVSRPTSSLPTPRPSPAVIPNQQSASKTPKTPPIPKPSPGPMIESPRSGLKVSSTIKKDPMASLFVPKRKSIPQRST